MLQDDFTRREGLPGSPVLVSPDPDHDVLPSLQRRDRNTVPTVVSLKTIHVDFRVIDHCNTSVNIRFATRIHALIAQS